LETTPVPLLECLHVAKDFRVAGERHEVLRDVSFRVERGEIALVRGRSGAGKSTLLALIAGLDRPARGSILLDGTDYGALEPRRLTALRRESIGIIFQSFNLIDSLSAAENVELALMHRGLTRAARQRRARDLLEELGVARPGLLPMALSEGLKQRVAIARALAHDPELVLADEPTAQLDPETAEGVVSLLLDAVTRRHASLLVMTHGGGAAELLGHAAGCGLELRNGSLHRA
jgi:putative ABC transport system ATP-binding protein